MAINIEECGQKDFQMVMEFLHGLMEESIKECFEMERRKAKALLSSRMELDTKATFLMITITAMENLKSRVSLNIRELFEMANSKDKDVSYSTTVRFMSESSETERKKDREF